MLVDTPLHCYGEAAFFINGNSTLLRWVSHFSSYRKLHYILVGIPPFTLSETPLYTGRYTTLYICGKSPKIKAGIAKNVLINSGDKSAFHLWGLEVFPLLVPGYSTQQFWWVFRFVIPGKSAGIWWVFRQNHVMDFPIFFLHTWLRR